MAEETMVEMVARALCSRSIVGNAFTFKGETIPREKFIDDQWPSFKGQARAAIEAMREPTHDMLVMMWKAHGEEDPSDTAAQFRKAYKAAIDVALKG